MLTLYIGNRNYSSWSMRIGVLMREAGIAHREELIRFDGFTPDSEFKQRVHALGAPGTVPVLVDEDLVLWDTLAISEYLAERHPELRLWPQDRAMRARARVACAEMHAGFSALRSACPMNLEAALPHIGALALRDKPAVRDDLARLDALWSGLLADYGGPMLFGGFSIADAYFAPVVMRVHTYGLPLSDTAAAYAQRVGQLRGVRTWKEAALAEQDFIAVDEPFRLQR